MTVNFVRQPLFGAIKMTKIAHASAAISALMAHNSLTMVAAV